MYLTLYVSLKCGEQKLAGQSEREIDIERESKREREKHERVSVAPPDRPS